MIRALILSLAATPVFAAPDIAGLIGACEAAVAAGEVAPLEAVADMRLDGMTWLGTVEGVTVVFSPMTDASTCSLLAWSDAEETLVPWSEVEAEVTGWAGDLLPEEDGLFVRASCDGTVPLITEVGPDRGGYAGIGELDPPAVRAEVYGVDAKECANAD